ncbi:amidohydrolase [Psychroserpens sp.]|uniref:amidohydrolase n=1 Tax=Psychroserpens sp. TaxID=2020870 RepID=UPI001B2DB0A8|nr:amidohydrolase [Psychroserpens sp.]MBO6607455.1 amidohydrolase [Psychroserpens sp.]MBO6631320.1 amidohydrolase [Psychroserpens sp.]MBO6654467.1 amidohydrolase [Psychroserpens sp.]MBO6681184.1 amidohydrolase [Psychroserpens sp.]MBO6749859.1 amidohydrolase [Psychroserpens sp.]
MKLRLLLYVLLSSSACFAQLNLDQEYQEIEAKVIEWRRDFHQNPELSNREFNTAEKIAAHLESLGIEVQTGVAKTGVVGLLKGDLPGKVIALRADIDALPVTERNDLPFKSEVVTEFLGTKTGVMHACGHDTHTAILMGTAELLSRHKDQIRGTVKFIFQPAEEGPPPGEEGGAKLMIKEGVLDNPKVDAIFGLHINSGTPVGTIKYKTEGIMAAVERFVINVKGKQTHGSQPWSGVDPILISAKIIDGLQTIISREARLIDEAAVITVGKITSGVRFNIIPESAELIGTVRTLDPKMKEMIIRRMTEMTETIAEAYGGEATIEFQNNTSITYNDVALVNQMLPTIQRVAGEDNVNLMKATTGGEDFSYFQEIVPGFYFFLGGMTPGNTNAFPHHTPDFKIDERGLLLGVKVMTELTFDYLNH